MKPLAITSRWRLAGLIVGMSVLMGNNFVALAIALRDSGPLTVQALAATIASGAAYLATRSDRSQSGPMSRRALVSATFIALALSVGSPIFIILGVERVNPGVVAMLLASTPIITLALERLILRLRITVVQSLGMVLGLGGVALIISPLRSAASSELLGIAFLFSGSLCWATGLILTRRLPGVRGNGRFVVWQFLLGLPVLYVLAIAGEGLAVTWTVAYVAAITYSGALSKGVGSVLQFRTVRLTSPLYSSLAAFLVPAVGVVSSFVILGERVLFIQLVGGLVVGAAVTLVLIGGSPPARHLPAPAA